MAGENPPKNPTENPGASAWDMEPHVEVKTAEYYRAHPGEINNFVAELIRLRGGAESIKRGATWDKEQRAHVDKDGVPRDWAHLTGYLKRHTEELDRFLEEYKSLKGGVEAPAEERDAAAGGGEEETPAPAAPEAPAEEPAPAETPAPAAAPAAPAEAAETESEHERLVNAVYKFRGVKILDAAEAVGIDLHDYAFGFEDLPDDDIQRILDELNRTGSEAPAAPAAETEPAPTPAPAAPEAPVEEPAPAETPAPAPAAPESSDGGAGSESAETGESAETERNRRRGHAIMEFLGRHRRIIAGTLLALGILFGSLFFGQNTDGENETIDNVPAITYNLDEAEQAIEDMESHGIIDGYGEQGMWLCETKAGQYNFADAVEVAEAVGTKDAREMVVYTARNQSESFADYMTSMPDEMRPASLRGIRNILDMERAIESMDDDEYDRAIDMFDFYMSHAEVEDVVLNGTYHNAYMRLDDSGGMVVHENMMLVKCTTHENGTHAKRIIFRGKDGSIIGEFIVKANADESLGKRGCMQVVRIGESEYVGMPDGPEDPEPDDPEPDDPEPDDPEPDDPEPDDPEPDDPEPDDPEPDDPEPDDPEPDDPEPDDPEPDEPEPTKPPKNPQQIQENMGTTPDESSNEIAPLDHTGDTEHPDVPADGSEGAYNPDTQTFGDPTPEPGTGDSNHDNVVDAAPEQTGAQDTSLESADGSGQTIQEVVENADVSTVNEDTGEQVNEQENRTEADQQQQQQQEQAHENEQQTVQNQQQSQEEAAANEEAHQDATPEEIQQEAADAFASGDF